MSSIFINHINIFNYSFKIDCYNVTSAVCRQQHNDLLPLAMSLSYTTMKHAKIFQFHFHASKFSNYLWPSHTTSSHLIPSGTIYIVWMCRVLCTLRYVRTYSAIPIKTIETTEILNISLYCLFYDTHFVIINLMIDLIA